MPSTARGHHTQAFAIARDIGAPLEQAHAREGLGQNHFHDGSLGEAAAYPQQARAIYQHIGASARRVEETLRHHRMTRDLAASTRRPMRHQ